MREITSETVWEIILFCLIGAFGGMVIAQFLPHRADMIMCILIGMCIMMAILTLYYAVDVWRQYKKSKHRKEIRRGAFIR